jgi:hypothetical protein
VSEDQVVEPEETTLRWFGPQRPGHHSPRGEVPVPVGKPCKMCEKPFELGDQGWTMPHGGPRQVDAQPYHYGCLFAVLGLNQP